MGDELFRAIGLNQNAPATQTAIPGLQAPSMGAPELIFRGVQSGILPIVASMRPRTGRGYATAAGLGLLGGLSGAVGEALGAQRLDPLGRQLAVTGALAQMGTKPIVPPAGTEGPMLESGQFYSPMEAPPGIAGPRMESGEFYSQPKSEFDLANLPPALQPLAAQYFTPLQQYKESQLGMTAKQAAIRASEAQTAADQARIPLIREQIKGVTAETTAREQATEEKKQQEASDAKLREAWLANPSMSPEQLARTVIGLGASKGAIDPLLNTLNIMSQVKYRDESLALHRQEQARLALQFKQTLERGDVDSARQIVAAEVKSLDSTIKDLGGRVTANAKIAQDIMTRPEEKVAREAQIAADLKQIEIEKAAKKDAEDRLKGLFAGTKSGAIVTGKTAPPEPPAPSPRFPVTVKTLEEFLKYKSRR